MYALGWQGASFKYVCGHMLRAPREFCQVKELKLVTARRGLCAFQAVVWGEEDFLLTVTDSPLFYKSGPLDILRLEVRGRGPGGRLPGRVESRLVGLVEDDDRQLKADILLTQEAIFVQGRNLQPVWVELEIPEEAPAGVYQGEVVLWRHRMFAAEEKVGEFPFTVEVKDVTLPLPQDYHFYLDLWQHPANISRKHETPLWSDAHFAVLEKYLASLAALGQKALTVIVSEIPWSGQGSVRDLVYPSDLFEYSMVRVRRGVDGEWRYDYSVLDRYVALGEKYGIREEIEVFGLINIWQFPEGGFAGAVNYLDDLRIRYYDEASGRFAFLQEGEEIEAYIRALEAHFAVKGWLERARVVADEPADRELYLRRLENLQRLAPRFKYKAAINQREVLASPPAGLLDFTPGFGLLLENWGDLAALRRQIPGRFLWYVCCGPEWPNTFIRSPLLESRLIPILTFFMGCDGFLRWNYTVWPERPRERLSFRAPYWPAGDTNFVYPGNFGGPLLSLRYKLLQKGIQDFELLWRLRERGAEAKLAAYAKLLFGVGQLCEKEARPGMAREDLYTLDEAAYEQGHELLLDALAGQ